MKKLEQLSRGDILPYVETLSWLSPGPLLFIPELKADGAGLVLIAKFGPCHISPSGFATPHRYVHRVLPKQDILSAQHRDIGGALSGKEIRIFADLQTEVLYVGPSYLLELARVGELGMEFTFRLDVKLPKELWIRLGGYPDWLVNVNEKKNFLFESFRELAAILARLKKDRFRLFVTRYDGDTFELFVHKDLAVVSYVDPDMEPFISWGGRDSDDVLYFPFSSGVEEFCAKYVIGKDEGICMLQQFIEKGKPTGLVPFSIPEENGNGDAS